MTEVDMPTVVGIEGASSLKRRERLELGLEAIRAECPKFDAWLGELESLGK